MRVSTAIAAFCAAAATASGGTITQQFSFDTGPGVDAPTLALAPFDSLGGLRELTGVAFAYDGSASFEIQALNTGATPLASGDWSSTIALQVSAQTLSPDGQANGYPLSASVFSFSTNIGAQTEDGPGVAILPLSLVMTPDQQILVQPEDLPAYVDQSGPIDLTIALDTDAELAFGPSDALGLSVMSEGILGELSVTYAFTEVPTPSSAVVLGLAGAAAMRRRRR